MKYEEKVANMDIFLSLGKVLLAILLVLLNGYFVAAEFSLVKVRHTRLSELAEGGSRQAKVALEVTSQLDAYLSACQLGITLASLGLGWLGEPAIAVLLEPVFELIPNLSPAIGKTISFILAFTIITVLHIVLGELIPKSLAIQKAEKIAVSLSGSLKLFYKIFYPVVRLLNGISNKALRAWGIEQASESDVAHSPEEIRLLVESSRRHGVIDRMEGNLLDNVFDFTDRMAKDVMVPRQDMVCLYTDDSIDEARKVAKKYGHIRYPLCKDDKDNVIGMIHLRDLIASEGDPAITSLSQIKRSILFIPENMPIAHLLKTMRGQRVHITVVVDEFGGTAGIVSTEDILEELVGEIYDEFEQEQPIVVKTGQDEYEFLGRVLLDDVSEVLNIDFEEEVSTVGGYIFNRLGRTPVKGDSISYKDYIFEVVEIEGHRIMKVKAKKNRSDGKASANAE